MTLYRPDSFREDDPTRSSDFIRAHSFATLVSSAPDGTPQATHLPLILDQQDESRRLLGHMARANPHWRELDGRPVLAIFAGPHAYISPSWCSYSNAVPTWNYVVVHVHGTVRMLPAVEARDQVLDRFMTAYEGQAWQGDEGFRQQLLEAIVAFEIPIQRWEGKWKLSQNHPRERLEEVIAGLEREPGVGDRATIAAWMRELL